jgi:hypothetical protein
MSPISAPRKETDPPDDPPDDPADRPDGPMLAVCTDRPGSEAAAIAVLGAFGARKIERAEGNWRDGGWADYDPRSPTEVLKHAPAKGDDEAVKPKEH